MGAIDIANRLKDKGILLSNAGASANVLKVRPPIVFERQHADLFPQNVRPIGDADLAALPMFLTIRELVQIGWLHTRVRFVLVLLSGTRLTRQQVLTPNITRAVRRCQELLDT